MKSYDVTIQMKALYLYLQMMLFVFQNFRKWNLKFGRNLLFVKFGSERVKGSFYQPKSQSSHPFIYLKPEKGIPFGWSLRVLALIGIIPGAIYEVKFVSANTKEPLDNVWLVEKGHRKFRQKIGLVLNNFSFISVCNRS